MTTKSTPRTSSAMLLPQGEARGRRYRAMRTQGNPYCNAPLVRVLVPISWLLC